MADWAGRLGELAGAAKVPGAVLGIWYDGETTIAPHGVLNNNTGVEVTADSLFQVGSITKPWTAILPMAKTEDQIYEYACHEANYAMSGILRGARAEKK